MLVYSNSMADKLGPAVQTMKKFLMGGVSEQASAAEKTAQIVKVLSLVIVAFIIGTIIFWSAGKLGLNQKNCNTLATLYDEAPGLSSIRPDSELACNRLRDFYIKTAYNCCAGGAFKNDYVNVCALKTCIQQGARCLDFEIYDVNGGPVIGVSTLESNHVKECYNSVPFEEAMQTVASHAFSGGYTSCADDPLILHFRIMSSHKEIFDQMAEALYRTLERRMLGKKYSYEYNGLNLGSIQLKNLMGKGIIIVRKDGTLLANSSLDEYTNMCSNAHFMRALRYNQVKYVQDAAELTSYNKQNMSIVLPDLGVTPNNPSAPLAMAYGCQLIGMSFQNLDANMQYNDLFFDKYGSAFALKPAHLRYEPVTIEVVPDNPEDYSFEDRDLKTAVPGLSFNI